MAEISMDLIKKLRAMTGAGVMDCKKALLKADGDIEKAVDELRKIGAAKVEKRLSREAKEGRIEAYVHPGSRLGVLVEINCESDFVASTEEFKTLAHEVALQIAAAAPMAVRREDIPEEIIEREKAIYRGQLEGSNKPPHIIEKIIEGKLEKFFQEKVLMEQPYIRDPEKTINDLVRDAVLKLGENIIIRRFVRYRVGEE